MKVFNVRSMKNSSERFQREIQFLKEGSFPHDKGRARSGFVCTFHQLPISSQFDGAQPLRCICGGSSEERSRKEVEQYENQVCGRMEGMKRHSVSGLNRPDDCETSKGFVNLCVSMFFKIFAVQ